MTQEVTTADDILTTEQRAEIMMEILTNTRGQVIAEDEMYKACDAVMELVFTCGLAHLRAENRIRFGWDVEAQELTIVLAGPDSPTTTWQEVLE